MATKLNNKKNLKKKAKSTPVALPETESKKPFVENYDLPFSYGSTNITLIVRDPNWIYAYWEIAPLSIETLKEAIGDQINNAAYVIRMYDVTFVDFNGHNANRWFDIEVGPHTNNWYINSWGDNATYCADLGIRLPDGRFFTLARSNFVTTPRKTQSWRTEQIWMEVKDDSTKQAPFVVGNIHKAENRQQERKDAASRTTQKGRRIYLSKEDIRQYYSRLSPLLKDIISKRPTARGASVSRGNPGKKVITLEEVRLSGLTRGQFVKKLLGGASEELVIMGASEQQPVGGASEQSQREAGQRRFFFEMGTELIVYGRTEPDAEVWLGNKKIPLRPDGTFTLRFALPDGKIPLGFTAVSNDKIEKREISTAVERFKTRYNP